MGNLLDDLLLRQQKRFAKADKFVEKRETDRINKQYEGRSNLMKDLLPSSFSSGIGATTQDLAQSITSKSRGGDRLAYLNPSRRTSTIRDIRSPIPLNRRPIEGRRPSTSDMGEIRGVTGRRDVGQGLKEDVAQGIAKTGSAVIESPPVKFAIENLDRLRNAFQTGVKYDIKGKTPQIISPDAQKRYSSQARPFQPGAASNLIEEPGLYPTTLPDELKNNQALGFWKGLTRQEVNSPVDVMYGRNAEKFRQKNPKTAAALDTAGYIWGDPLLAGAGGAVGGAAKVLKGGTALGAAKLLPKIAPRLAAAGTKSLAKTAARQAAMKVLDQGGKTIYKGFGKGKRVANNAGTGRNLVDEFLKTNPTATADDVAKFADDLTSQVPGIEGRQAQKFLDEIDIKNVSRLPSEPSRPSLSLKPLSRPQPKPGELFKTQRQRDIKGAEALARRNRVEGYAETYRKAAEQFPPVQGRKVQEGLGSPVGIERAPGGHARLKQAGKEAYLADDALRQPSQIDDALAASQPDRLTEAGIPSPEAQAGKIDDAVSGGFKLPDDEVELSRVVDDMQKEWEGGVRIDLQLFAEAKEKLKRIRKFPENPKPDLSRPIEDRIAIGYDKPPLLKGRLGKIKKGLSDTYQTWVDRNSALTKYDRKVGIKADNAGKASGTVHKIGTDKLVDKSGNVIGEGFMPIMKDIPEKKIKKFWAYMSHEHNVARHAEDKPVWTDYSSKASTAEAARYLAENPEFAQLQRRYNTFMKNFSNAWLKDTGLVSGDTMATLQKKYPNYFPTQRDVSRLDDINVGFNTKAVGEAKALKTAAGSDIDLRDPMVNVLNMVNRTVRKARRNEVAQTIVDTLKGKGGVDEFAEILPANYAGDLNQDNIVKVFVDGENIHMKLKDEKLIKSIAELSAGVEEGSKLKEIAKDAAGLFKSTLTSRNPFFAGANLLMDVPASFIQGSTKNPVKFTSDLLKSTADLVQTGVSRSPIAKKLGIKAKPGKYTSIYEGVGARQAGFYSQSDDAKFVSNILKEKSFMQKSLVGKTKQAAYSPVKKVEEFNTFIETIPRLAEFRRVLEKTGSVDEALHAAGEVTLNFNRGGNAAKKVDELVPFFNAGIQGVDKAARVITKNPGKTAVGGLIGITAPTTAVYAMNQIVDPKGYAALSNRDKDRNFVFPKMDGSGTYIKLPKTRIFGTLFGSLFERVYRQAGGDKEAWKGFLDTAGQDLPGNPVENNYLSPIVGLKYNKDWADRDIVPNDLKELSKHKQFDERTTEIAKEIAMQAKKVGLELSPKEMDYIIRSYTGVVGQIGQPLTTKGGKPVEAALRRFNIDPAFSNQATQDFYEEKEKATTAAKDEKFEGKIKFGEKTTDKEKVRNIYNKGASIMSLYRKQINATDNESKQKSLRKNMNKVASDLKGFDEKSLTRLDLARKKSEMSMMLKRLKLKSKLGR